ncbi:hypothetical protein APHAL10511_005888 [Amanita phalloides]|nr:hypothetical protein APHAL10511_005888 [Amanita phalloides]
MSIWNSGEGETNDEVHVLRNKLNIQDAQLAAQQTQLIRQAQRLEECQLSLNDVVHKLNQETERSLQLENDFRQRTDDYQNQSVSLKNLEMALTATREATKAKDLEVKELQSLLDTASRASDQHGVRTAKLEREKATLEARVHELEAEVQKQAPLNATVHQRAASQPRPSSTPEDRIRILEKELEEAHATLSKMEITLRSNSQKLSQTQGDLIRIDNEKAAMGKRMSSQISDLIASLEEKEAELQIVKTQVGDASREDELIKRIEEDEAKIAALEISLRDAQDSSHLKSQTRRLAEQAKKVTERDERCIELVREKEDVLDQLADAGQEIQRLTGIIAEQSNSSTSRPEMNETDMKVEPGSTTDDATLAHIERLLAAVDRLRTERDDLRRDIQFLESESKFTIESLEAKLSAPITNEDATRAVQSRKIVEHSALVATASAVIIAHLDSRCSQLHEELLATSDKRSDLQSRLQIKDQLVTEQAEQVHDMETRMKETTFNLQGLCKRRDDIESQLTLREIQWEEERQRLNRVNQSTLDGLGRHVQDLSRTLENVESERNSLALQITNLTSELRSVQQELTNAESRYSSLQFQQLSTMSTTEANRTLRDQLKEMEMRVTRRTEQIGIHQHDIRRLETNIRLQEERMGEMTAEIETLAAQKDAMVEDCADAREARDSALSRVETLEMELETLDSKLEQSDKALVSLVAVVMQNIGHAKGTIRMMREKEASATGELRAAYDLHQMLARMSEEDKRSLATLQQSLHDSDAGIRQMGIALAISRVEVKTAASTLKQEKDRVDARVNELLMDLNQYENRCASVTAELEASHLKNGQHALRITDLEARVLELHSDVEKRASETEILLNDLSHYRERLKTSLDDTEYRTAEKNLVETTLESIKFSHAQELKTLQEQLITTSETIKQLQLRLTSVEMEKEEMASDYAHVKQELEKHVSTAVRTDEAEEGRLVLQRRHEDELFQLRNSLHATRVENEKAQERILILESSHQQIQNELNAAYESYMVESAQFNEESRRVKEKLETDLTVLDSELDKRSCELTGSLEDVRRLTADLGQLSQDHEKEREKNKRQIHILEAQLRAGESALMELKDRTDCVTKDLNKSSEELSAVHKERKSLQECMTSLEAELQRSVSMTRFLESKVKECEETIAMLSAERELQREEILRTEQLSKTAEVNLTLQSAQHRREMAELRNEIDTLQSKPNLAAALAELEERNNEMEELLRNKCTEIEENDDKVLEILKDNKALTAKVESLNRKVQNLQTKLTAAKASIPKPSAVPATSSSVTSKTCPQSTPPPSESSSHLSKSTPATSSGTHRVVSDGSSVIRSKTPDSRCAHPTVFKTKTPDKHISSISAPEFEETDQVIGKKRRAPEDFDSLPPQGFTVDSVPDDHNENQTPRVRRMRSGGLTGFTPVRRTHPHSPKRGSSASMKTSSLIADVTNSPRGKAQGSGKGGKRSWLGKIRGSAPHS